MAPRQRLSPECERDSAGADRSKFHGPSCLGGHPDDELAEVASLQHSDESAWRVFETVDDVLAVANATRGDARTNLAQEAHRKHKRSVGRATPASWVWSSRPIPA